MFFIGQKVRVRERHPYSSDDPSPEFEGVIIEENRATTGGGINGVYVMVTTGMSIGTVYHVALTDIVFSDPKGLQSKIDGSGNNTMVANLLGSLMSIPPANGYQ